VEAVPATPAPAAAAVTTPETTVPTTAGDLVVTEGELAFAGRVTRIPATGARLRELLGPPSRTVEDTNSIDVWDDLGIKSYRRPGRNLVKSIVLALSPAHRPQSPRSTFRGRVVLPSGTIDGQATPAQLRAAGLIESLGEDSRFLRLGRTQVLLVNLGGDTTLSISWLGPAPQPPPLPDDALFEAEARAYGFPFDETMREVAHRGNVSVLDSRSVGSGGVLGRSLFTMGAIGEVALRRGYDFLVILDESDTTEGWQYTIGFTHAVEPDCAREFPGEPLTKECTAMRADFGMQALGGWWPFAGVMPGPPPDEELEEVGR
jgi:hypothetical protein